MLDDEIQPIVQLMNAAPGPPAHEVPVHQARAAHDRETEVMSGPGEEVAEVRRLEAPGPAGPIPIRLYRPRGAEPGAPLPLVAYFHGGGWTIGTLDGFDPLCRALANASGALIASVGYLAFLGGPPLIGFLGEHVGVLRALTAVAVLLAMAAAIAGTVRPLPAPERR